MADAVALGVVVSDADAVDAVVDEFRQLLPSFVQTVRSPGDICIVLTPEPGSPRGCAVDDSFLAYVTRGLGELVRHVVLFDHGLSVAGTDEASRALSFMEWLRSRGRPSLARSSDLWHHYVVARLRSVVGNETELFDGRVAVLFLHPNTLRYRLRRISEITGLDLSDPVDRFVAELQIRLRFSRSC